MTRRSPLLTLNNGVQMPALGLGVFQNPPEQTVSAVESAIAQGYRLIDTAASYFNERQVGEGMRLSEIARDDVFLETKVWISDYGYDATLHAFERASASLASTASICCFCISRCRADSISRWTPTGRSRSCSPMASCAQSA
jgi:diketogulonate reductase-like aldo/keto reductase